MIFDKPTDIRRVCQNRLLVALRRITYFFDTPSWLEVWGQNSTF